MQIIKDMYELKIEPLNQYILERKTLLVAALQQVITNLRKYNLQILFWYFNDEEQTSEDARDVTNLVSHFFRYLSILGLTLGFVVDI